MRIVGGAHRGKRLSAPEGRATRPTSDRTRQAVFNILEHAPWCGGVRGARVVDLFAGSGALGLEALSRGAAFCLFVEAGEAAREVIRDNLKALNLSAAARIHRGDAAGLGPRPGGEAEAFDLAVLDPPYRQGLGERALDALAAGAWLRPGALCVLERAADEAGIAPAGFEVLDLRRYGVAQVGFLRFIGPSPS